MGQFHLTVYTPSLREVRAGTQGKNPQVESEAKVLKLTDFFPWLAQPGFL